MFGFRRRAAQAQLIDALHASIVAASRAPALYGDGALPDTVEGRFESLVLHGLVVLRRLRQLPAPADDVAQDLVDAIFAHLEIALREMGVGDFGVPKRMKKLASAFYHRTERYSAALDAGSAEDLSREMAERAGAEPLGLLALAGRFLVTERMLARLDLEQLLADPAFVAAVRPPALAEAAR